MKYLVVLVVVDEDAAIRQVCYEHLKAIAIDNASCNTTFSEDGMTDGSQRDMEFEFLSVSDAFDFMESGIEAQPIAAISYVEKLSYEN